MGSNADKVKGKAKQVVGKATDDKELQAKGKAQETKGKIKGSGEKLVDNVDDALKKPE